MILLSIFACLSKAESSVQSALAKEWASVPQADQDELLIILKATNIIKQNNTLNGDEIIALIEKETGSQFVDSWLTVIDKVAASLGITIPAGSTPVQTVQIIAAALTPKQGDNFGDTVLGIAAYTATNLFPAGVMVREVAIPLVQWVYDNVFKPMMQAPAAVTQAAADATDQASSN
jgi:hypothetical protein